MGVTARVIRNKIVKHTENWEGKRERDSIKSRNIEVYKYPLSRTNRERNKKERKRERQYKKS